MHSSVILASCIVIAAAAATRSSEKIKSKSNWITGDLTDVADAEDYGTERYGDYYKSPASSQKKPTTLPYETQSKKNYAQIIPLSVQTPQPLKEIYKQNDVVLALNFASEPNRWLPYDRNNATSEFEWRYSGTNFPADNAYIKLPCNDDANGAPYKTATSPDCASQGAELISAPFQRWFPQDNEAAYTIYNEGTLDWKNTAMVSASQRIVFRLKFSCKIFNAEKHPFPANLVTRPDDDFRLANCFFGIGPSATNESNVYFFFAITNKSIWAIYESDAGQVFLSKRRVGIRRTYDDIVDVGVEYNSLTQQATYYVNGQPVWVISQLGFPPPNDGFTKIDLGQGTMATIAPRITEFSFSFGTHKCLDETDPNNQATNIRLVKVDPNSTYCRDTDQFYDPLSLRPNNLWGQTVKMTVFKVAVVRTQATTTTNTQPTPSNADNANDYWPSASSSSSWSPSNQQPWQQQEYGYAATPY